MQNVTIKTNQTALENRIKSEVERAISECQSAANSGRTNVFFTTDKDIWRDVRDILDDNNKICIPTIFSRYQPSRLAVEHFGERTEIKLVW